MLPKRLRSGTRRISEGAINSVPLTPLEPTEPPVWRPFSIFLKIEWGKLSPPICGAEHWHRQYVLAVLIYWHLLIDPASIFATKFSRTRTSKKHAIQSDGKPPTVLYGRGEKRPYTAAVQYTDWF